MKVQNFKRCLSHFKERLVSKKLKVVYEDDVQKLLSSLGLLEKINKGEIYCSNCEQKMTIERFGYLKVINGKLELFCTNCDCHV